MFDETTNQKHILGSSPEAGRGPKRGDHETSEVLPNEPEWPTAPCVGVTQSVGMPWVDGYNGYMRSSIWHGWSCGQRNYAT
jgi:hypothetical protein